MKAIIWCVFIVLLSAGFAMASNNEQSKNENTAMQGDPQKDFDFFIGSWKVHNRRLKERLKGSDSWDKFDGTVVARHIWGGKANTDEYEADSPIGHIQGMTLRLFDPKSQQWSLYWANSANGTLEKPMIGGFENGRGEFYDQEMFEGRSIYVRYIWSDIYRDLLPVGTSLLRGWWKNLGNQLDHGIHTD
jgi:hypothetical protein